MGCGVSRKSVKKKDYFIMVCEYRPIDELYINLKEPIQQIQKLFNRLVKSIKSLKYVTYTKTNTSSNIQQALFHMFVILQAGSDNQFTIERLDEMPFLQIPNSCIHGDHMHIWSIYQELIDDHKECSEYMEDKEQVINEQFQNLNEVQRQAKLLAEGLNSIARQKAARAIQNNVLALTYIKQVTDQLRFTLDSLKQDFQIFCSDFNLNLQQEIEEKAKVASQKKAKDPKIIIKTFNKDIDQE